MKNTTAIIFFALPLLIISCINSTEEKTRNEPEHTSDPTSKLSPLEIGQNIAMTTQGVLGKNLMNAINKQGTEYAVSFCSTKAIHLTDSSGLALNATVKRVSDKNRNPDNKANWDELNYIQAAKRDLVQGKMPSPQLLNSDSDKQIAYYPIITNQMCMQCHGQPDSEISPKTLSKINKLYPNDQATGYNVDELRGIWVVEMDDK